MPANAAAHQHPHENRAPTRSASWPIEETTETDPAAHEWAIDDVVVRLRRWGTDEIFALQPSMGEVTIGSSDICGLQVREEYGRRVSRLHARLVFDRDAWHVVDLGSTNGIRVDGARRPDALLEPGVELGIGGVTLVAESPRSIDLRAFLSRLLGWRPDRMGAVDRAARAIRMAAAHRMPLVLRGDGDLVPIARAIHLRALGVDRPFIVCDPRRRHGRATVRSAENYEHGMPAFAAATGGTMCVRSMRLPRDFDAVVAAHRAPDCRVQLAVCAHAAEDCKPFLTHVITVPSLSTRHDELERIVAECAAEAGAQSGIPEEDKAWVIKHSTTVCDIEKAIHRIVAVRGARNLSSAAEQLGMAPVSLSRWLRRRTL